MSQTLNLTATELVVTRNALIREQRRETRRKARPGPGQASAKAMTITTIAHALEKVDVALSAEPGVDHG